ncbi:MAG: tetratricopeptide repeat protein [Alphaproteobacteria bacterium]|nr:tetratricopeptide repeat protein [Alphaproteobacteria bacterium]
MATLQQAMDYHRRGKIPKAVKAYENVLANNNSADVKALLALALADDGQPARAAALIAEAVNADPNSALFRLQAAEVMLKVDDFPAAAVHLFWLEKNSPQQPALRGLQARHYFGVGLRWHNQQREDLALPYYEKALAADARASEMWNNYGQTLHALGRYDEALAAYASSIKAAPDDASAHFHHAMQQMAMGDDAAGWKNYAWRFKAVTGLKYVREDMPVWQGESLAGRRLLVADEQGFGDNIMMWRYLPLLRQQGAHIIYAARPPLAPLLQMAALADEVVLLEDIKRVVADVQTLPMDWPARCDTHGGNIPGTSGYLHGVHVPPHVVLPKGPRPRWGLVWRGNPKHAHDARRSIPLGYFDQLFTKNIDWFLLTRPADLPEDEQTMYAPSEKKRPNMVMWGDKTQNFADLAAVLSQLDGLVTVDTATAHVAGAMGLKTFVLLPLGADWRWLTHRTDSPWYNSVRLFRQSHFADWQTPLQHLAETLGSD